MRNCNVLLSALSLLFSPFLSFLPTHSRSFAAHLDSFPLAFQRINLHNVPEGGQFYILISGDCPPLAVQGVAHCIRPSVSRIHNERERERESGEEGMRREIVTLNKTEEKKRVQR